MERINMGNSNLKHPSSNAGTNMKEINQLKNNNKNCSNKVKNLWNLSSESNGAAEADLLGLFSWPPRSYTCSFCKREFRSAQALGGHMNVHRRDRARLRQSPPRDHSPYNSPLNLNLDPNPNFSFNSKPSLSSAKPPLISSLPSFNIPPSVSTISTTPPATVTEMRKWGHGNFVELNTHHSSPMISQDFIMKSKATKRLFELEKFGSLVHEKEAAAAAALEKSDIVRLELEIGLFGEVKEDLDLELRLGCI